MHDIFSEKIFKITRPNFYDAKNFRTEEDKPYSSYEYGNIQTHGHTKLTVLAKSAEFGKGYLNIFFFFTNGNLEIVCVKITTTTLV